jgi:hypothetical protein
VEYGGGVKVEAYKWRDYIEIDALVVATEAW